MKVAVGITDDHRLFVKGLSQLINSFNNFEVIVEAFNGKDLLDKLASTNTLPHILLIDVYMPGMDGAETAQTLSKRYPSIKLVAVSSNEEDITVIKMIRAGCRAYFMKYIDAGELERALVKINSQGYYNAASHFNLGTLVRIALGIKEVITLTDLENEFLQLASSDLTARQIAARMDLPEKTINRYYGSLCAKLHVQNRAGMVLEAVKRNLVSM